MRYQFSKIYNFRDLGGYNVENTKMTKYGSFFRSDAPASISDEDLTLIRKLNITDVIDFRSDYEIEQVPNGFETVDGITVHHISFFDPLKDTKAFGEGPISESYMMVAEHSVMTKAMEIMISAEGAVLFHCSAGKDRTGTTAALLLMLAGVCDKDIIADYVISEVYLKEILDVFATNSTYPSQLIYPTYDNIYEFLKLFHEKHPCIVEFIKNKGFSDSEILTLKSKLI